MVETCSICLEPIDKVQRCTIDSCIHIFCHECILSWSNTCPVCRERFTVVKRGRKRERVEHRDYVDESNFGVAPLWMVDFGDDDEDDEEFNPDVENLSDNSELIIDVESDDETEERVRRIT